MDIAALYYELTNDVRENRERLLAGLEEGLSRADLAVGPETATIGIGLDPAEIRAGAEPLDGETATRAQAVVDRLGGAAAFGLPERTGGEIYNACVLLAPGRDPRVYRQLEYPVTHGWTTAYGEDRVFEAAGGRIAPAICAELSFAEKRRFLAGSASDLVAAPANWADGDGSPPLIERWAEWSAAFDCPLAVSNVYSPPERGDRNDEFDGPAAILDDGSVLARTDHPGDVIHARL